MGSNLDGDVGLTYDVEVATEGAMFRPRWTTTTIRGGGGLLRGATIGASSKNFLAPH